MRRLFSRLDASPTERGWNPLTLAALAALWIAACGNWPLWRTLSALPETASAHGLVFLFGFGLMVAALTLVLLAPLAWRRTVKPVLALFLVSTALGAHFMGTYGVVIDPTMMTNVLQTNPSETRDLLSGRLLISVLLLAGVPIVLLWRVPVRALRWRPQALRNLLAAAAGLALLLALVFALFADLSSTMRNHKSVRYLINPANSFYALAALVRDSQARPTGPPQPIGLDARVAPRAEGTKPPLLVLVVGETARSDHFSLNGYTRATNPALAPLGVASFRDVTSCGTSTAASLPCMFSHLGRVGYEARDADHENLLDLAQRAGLAVLWLDNQAGCKSLCERVPHADARQAAPGGTAPVCAGDECFDEALLHGLDERVAALPKERVARGVLLVLHQMGSHGPAYFRRSPPALKPFQPECTTNVLQQCDHDALLNAYDNSIAYTDTVLARSIAWLGHQTDRFDPALLYVSDHGESLGERNLYLHGLPYAVAPREQKHVPMIAWLAPQSQRSTGVTLACLKERLDQPLSHDNLFHTVLGLLQVTATEYQQALDAFAPCRAP